MDDTRRQKLELLATLAEFNTGLVKDMGIIVREFAGAREDDTDAFMKSIVEAMNWEIEAFNVTKDIINEDGTIIDRDDFEDAITNLNKSIKDKDDGAIANSLEECIVFFQAFGDRAQELVATAS